MSDGDRHTDPAEDPREGARDEPPDDQSRPADDPRSDDPRPDDNPSSGRERPTDDTTGSDQPSDPGTRHHRGTGQEQEPGSELSTLARGIAPPRPPRRTGVFLDPEDLREHVGGLLRAILGGHEVDAFGNFTFTHEHARIFVTIGSSPIGPQVGVFSVTNIDLDLTPELARFLLTTNHRLGFGAFSYDPENRALWLRHTLLGTTLDLPELQTTVAAVATTAASLDQSIRDRFGGRTFQEAPNDVQRRMEPPSPEAGPAAGNAGGYL